jgi:heme-degrading monooxygenase HmoA
MFANTPKPPYFAVIFTSVRTSVDEGYEDTDKKLEKLVKNQPGFLGMESVRKELGITVCYWKDMESVKSWARNSEHQLAKKRRRNEWYKEYRVRICKVEKELWQLNESG